MSEQIGCGDNSCVFSILRESGGMGTNGGCQCFERLLSWSEKAQCWNRVEVRVVKRDVLRLVAALREARAEVERLGKALTQETRLSLSTQRQLDEARDALRNVAERQREACAKQFDQEGAGIVDKGNADFVRATPLVTENK